MAVKPVPEGFHTITPQLTLADAAKAIEHYKKALGAVELARNADPSGKKIWHSMLKIGDSMIFVNDNFPDMGGSISSSSLWLYVTDVDASFKRATEAGFTAKMPPADMFWGDRMAHVGDPYGQLWTLATRTKDLTPAEMKAAEEKFIAQTKHGKPA